MIGHQGIPYLESPNKVILYRTRPRHLIDEKVAVQEEVVDFLMSDGIIIVHLIGLQRGGVIEPSVESCGDHDVNGKGDNGLFHQFHVRSLEHLQRYAQYRQDDGVDMVIIKDHTVHTCPNRIGIRHQQRKDRAENVNEIRKVEHAFKIKDVRKEHKYDRRIAKVQRERRNGKAPINIEILNKPAESKHQKQVFSIR